MTCNTLTYLSTRKRLPCIWKGGLQRCWSTFWLSLCALDSSIPSDILGGSLIFSPDRMTICLIVRRRSFWVILLVLQLLVMTGAPKVLGRLLRSVSGNFLPAVFLLISWQIRSQRNASLLSDGILSVAIFPHVL